ncbi:MFS transporter [Streptomyces sp. 8N616]|uniref:MFS transporter n=1 Tax=Streptomyces sp. 8N616 TaxID=3457414 RepID=UPI003FD4C5E7
MPGQIERLLPEPPELRRIACVTLANTFGNGMFLATQVLFFIRAAGLSAAEVGLGLAIAGAVAIFAGVPLGRLSDRWGPRRVLLVILAVQCVGVASYTTVHSFAVFVPLATVVSFIDQGGNAVRGALVAAVLPAQDRVRARAFLRAVANVGMGAGAAVAALALQRDTAETYQWVVIGDAVTFLVAAALLLRVPAPTPPPRPNVRRGQGERSRTPALADRPYLLVTVLNGVTAAHSGVLTVGVPLWVAGSTDAPRWTISAVMVVNMAMVVALQVRASRGTETPQRAARALRRAGGLLAAGCVVFGLAHGLPAPLAVLVLLLGGIVHTLGEMLSEAAGWSLSYDLADPAAPGEYQGVFNIGNAAGMLLSPLLVTGTVIHFGLAGWLLLAAVFLLAGIACVPTIRRAATRLAHVSHPLAEEAR